MNDILKILSGNLDREIRATLLSRVENMMRIIKYQAEKSSLDYSIAVSKGWTYPKFEVLCSLIAFYQEVIGPLSSVSKVGSSTSLGSTIPIVWGNQIHINTDLYNKLVLPETQWVAPVLLRAG